MRLPLAVLVLVLSSVAPCLAGAAPLADRLDALIQQSGVDRAGLGLWVADALPGTAPLYALNDDHLLRPASVTKIVTALAVLKGFPPSHRFVTRLLGAGTLAGGRLAGSLYLKGAGDPAFVSEQMWLLVDDLVRHGVTAIAGDLVVDDGLFDRDVIDASRDNARVDRPYDAPVGAASFNWNTAAVYVGGAARAGEPAEVRLDPPNGYVQLRNRAETRAGAPAIAVDRVVDAAAGGDVIGVTGHVPPGAPPVAVYRNITNPALWTGANLAEFLRQRGIEVQGRVRAGPAPADARRLAEVGGQPIGQIVADMLKYSNNFVAEMLAKDLAAAAGERPATLASGTELVRRAAAALGVPPERLRIANPSGLSYETRLAPRDLGLVLQAIRADFTIFPEFVAALPIAGVDGTLAHRMAGTPAQRWVRAKTGSLNEVVGLAGYAGGKDGSIRAFVFIYNGGMPEARIHQLFDRMAAAVVP